MEILLCEVDALFPGRFAPIILANPRRNSMYGGKFWRNRAGKCVLTLHSGISVTDRIKINELNKQ